MLKNGTPYQPPSLLKPAPNPAREAERHTTALARLGYKVTLAAAD